jgi:hypothetical protein
MIYVPPKRIHSAETEWALLLSAQEKVFSVDQARALGWKDHELRWKVDSGRWQRVYRGIYATFPGPLPNSARQWALVLLIGETAVLSHQTAAELQGFARGPASQIHVTVPAGKHPTRWRGLRGVVVHRSANVRADPQPWFRLPRTPVVQTVLDLVESALDLDDAYAWLSRAVTTDAAAVGMITQALKQRKKVRGRAWLEDALTDVSDGVHFPLERRWTRDVERAHGLPTATHQARRDGADGIRFLDNLYEPYDLSVELDGAAFHAPEERDADHYRDNETTIALDARVLRYGFRQVANRPCVPAAQFARALIKHGWPAKTLKSCPKPNCAVTGVIAGLRSSSHRP